MTSIPAHASPLNGLPRSDVSRILLIAAVVGAIESLVGAFALDDDPFLGRTIYVIALNLVGAVYNILAYWMVRRLRALQRSFWGRVLAADLLTLVPGALTVWGSTFLVGGHPGTALHFLAYAIAFGFLLSGTFIAAFVAPTLDRAWEHANDAVAAPQVSSPQPDFIDRLPSRLRGAELWALKAEDHYVRVATSRGEALIRMRLADAMRELKGMKGVRSHRSWWIVRSAIKEVRREDGRVRYLILPNGREAPVSRSGAQDLTKEERF